jgi:hypothetical protein
MKLNKQYRRKRDYDDESLFFEDGVSDEEAIKAAIARNKAIIEAHRAKHAKDHGMMDCDGNAHITPERLTGGVASALKTKLCCEFWIRGIILLLIILIAELCR